MQEYRAQTAINRAIKTYSLPDAPVAYYLAFEEIQKIENELLRENMAFSLGHSLVKYARQAVDLYFKGDVEAAQQDENLFKLAPVILHQLCLISPRLAESIDFKTESERKTIQ